jgi:hypothetical protein
MFLIKLFLGCNADIALYASRRRLGNRFPYWLIIRLCCLSFY